MKKVLLAILIFLTAGLFLYSYFALKNMTYLMLGIAWVCIGIGYCIKNFGKSSKE